MSDRLSRAETRGLLAEHYSDAYKGAIKHDSPEKSRVSMNQRILGLAAEGILGKRVLSIGAGRQMLERQLLKHAGNKKGLMEGLRVVTMDIARIAARNLFAKKYGVEHTRADAVALPYPDNQFGLVVSNHAIDFAPQEAYGEVRRVLAPGGKAIFYFHHPSMLEAIDWVKNRGVNKLWQYLKDSRVLLENEEQIRDRLAKYGLEVEEVKLNTDGMDQWWEVAAHKPGATE